MGRLALILVGLLVCGLIAAGCGDDDESSSTTPTTGSEQSTSEDSTTEDTSTSDDQSTSEESTSQETSTTEDSGDSGGVDAEGVYQACAEVVEGTEAEEQALVACERARDAFESCAEQAGELDGSARDEALGICQEGADQAIAALESSPGY